MCNLRTACGQRQGDHNQGDPVTYSQLLIQKSEPALAQYSIGANSCGLQHPLAAAQDRKEVLRPFFVCCKPLGWVNLHGN
jgi:hypothetical protein